MQKGFSSWAGEVRRTQQRECVPSDQYCSLQSHPLGLYMHLLPPYARHPQRTWKPRSYSYLFIRFGCNSSRPGDMGIAFLIICLPHIEKVMVAQRQDCCLRHLHWNWKSSRYPESLVHNHPAIQVPNDARSSSRGWRFFALSPSSVLLFFVTLSFSLRKFFIFLLSLIFRGFGNGGWSAFLISFCL